MAKKAKSHAKLKKELDSVFSQYIRWYYADDNGYVECYTCNTIKHVKEMHNGHFLSRRHLSTRWNEDNCRPQCPRCNLYAQGEQWKYGLRLTADIGAEKVQELQALSKQAGKFTTAELQEIIDYYKARLIELTY